MRDWYWAWWVAAERRAELLREAERERLASQCRVLEQLEPDGGRGSLERRAASYGSRKVAAPRSGLRSRLALPVLRAAAARPAVSVWPALGTVYLVWGSTYLAIRVAINTLPPLLMASARFLLGAILFACSKGTGEAEDRPPSQWPVALISGRALLLGGNGGVVLAERSVPTELVALLVATVPLNIAVIDRVGRRLSRRAALGLVLGFGGVALLLGPSSAGSMDPVGALLALLAAISWAAGSIYSRGAGLPARPLVGTAMQMLTGGFLLAVVGAVIVAALVLVVSARPDSPRPRSHVHRPLSFEWRQRARPDHS